MKTIFIAALALALAGCFTATDTGYRAEKRAVQAIPREQALAAIRAHLQQPFMGFTYEITDDAFVTISANGRQVSRWRDMDPRLNTFLGDLWVFFQGTDTAGSGWKVASREDGEVVMDAIEPLHADAPRRP